MNNQPRPAILLAIIAALAMLAAACSGGGTSGSDKTATQAAADGPPPTAADIAGFVRAGFEGLEIEYGVVNIPSFDNLDVLLGVLDDCDKGNVGDGVTKDSADYWAGRSRQLLHRRQRASAGSTSTPPARTSSTPTS